MPIDFSQRRMALSPKAVKAGTATLVAVLVGIVASLIVFEEPKATMPQVGTVGQASTSQKKSEDEAATGIGNAGGDVEATSAPGATPERSGAPSSAATPSEIMVSVVGLVHRPGVVRVASTARVNDAIDAAGGMLPEANPASVLLAAPLADGQQIVVSEVALASEAGSAGSGVVGAGPVGAGPVGAGGSGAGGATGAGAGSAGGKININTADAAQLEELPGVGPATAKKIIAHRDKNGPFSSVDALEEVPGLGPAKVEALRDMAMV